MPLIFNIHEPKCAPLVLQGELPAQELGLERVDELVHPRLPLAYDITVQQNAEGFLAQGTLRIVLDCDCARCLQAFPYPLVIEKWACLITLEGEEKATVTNDSVDLTPYIREDILLAFPQRPLCKTDCQGIYKERADLSKKDQAERPGESGLTSSPWSELDKLNL